MELEFEFDNGDQTTELSELSNTELKPQRTAITTPSMEIDELLEVRSKFKKQFALILIIVAFHVGYVMAYTN